MKHVLIAAMFAVSAIAAPASAATYLTFNGTTGTFGNNLVASPTFSDTFNVGNFPAFSIPNGYLVSLTISSSYAGPEAGGPGDIDFTSVTFNGADFTKVGEGKYEFRTFDGAAALANTLLVAGTSGNAASYSGTIDVTAAVPEAATWAMLVTGFGLGGMQLRRRRSQVAVAI
ncbi:FxDxF family PEP-CTERM protein [Sphingomonas sp. ID0503]|uniref:FxDxF family PEP-CTERM protein n=1 Tax=Sphingomonas sp. ID0503 TaxID=3399691 RepID=UPI003AFADD7B